MRRRSAALVLAVLTAAPAAPAAQDAHPLLPLYRDAVRSYQTTRTLDVARGLVGAWRREDFEAVTSAEARAGDRNRIEAAAFHLEIALGVAPSTPDGAMLHVRLGERVLGGEPVAPESMAADRVFAGRWYGVAASIFLAQTDTVRARQVLERGLAAVPGAAALHVLAGTIEDMEAQRFEPDAAQDAGGSQRAMTRNSRSEMEGSVRLALAERAYRRAQALDPVHVGARIRLGRVLLLLHRLPEAQAMLEAARAGASTLADRYLACLFLGDLHRVGGNLDARRARRSGRSSTRTP